MSLKDNESMDSKQFELQEENVQIEQNEFSDIEERKLVRRIDWQ